MSSAEGGAGGGSHFVPREDLLKALMDMGVSKNAATKVPDTSISSNTRPDSPLSHTGLTVCHGKSDNVCGHDTEIVEWHGI